MSDKTFGFETLSIHEASPGHHFQISIQQEVESLPAFRRFGGYTAYAEGWALYAESLGKEMGLFTDPYQWYGRLSDEQLRAMRLVVDTGLHYYGWDRQQAIDYMLANSSMAESDVVAEVERYIVIPGQALAYKVGQRVIRELREEAEAELGEKFDVRAFHRQVLTDGALPMGVLQVKIREWIASQKAKLEELGLTALQPQLELIQGLKDKKQLASTFAALQRDAYATHQQIGEQVHLSASQVSRRVQRLHSHESTR
mgnify:CR=1 FL=1